MVKMLRNLLQCSHGYISPVKMPSLTTFFKGDGNLVIAL